MFDKPTGFIPIKLQTNFPYDKIIAYYNLKAGILLHTDIRSELLLMGEKEYKDFHSRLMPTIDKSKIIGIRIPVLRNYAKFLTDYDDFLNDLPHKYYEENNLHAFLIERERDFDKCIEKLEHFLPYVDNWATCDSMKPKVLKKNCEKLLEHVKRWIQSNEIYTIRYGINMLMSFFLDDKFHDTHLKIVADIDSQEYYVNMMRAWYFATALAKQNEKTLPILENYVLDVWTHNKTIQKAIESYRISKAQKEYLKTLKICSRDL